MSMSVRNAPLDRVGASAKTVVVGSLAEVFDSRRMLGIVQADRAEVGPAVLSMRHGIRNVLWVHELAGAETRASQMPRRIAPDAAVVRSRVEVMGDDERRRSREA